MGVSTGYMISQGSPGAPVGHLTKAKYLDYIRSTGGPRPVTLGGHKQPHRMSRAFFGISACSLATGWHNPVPATGSVRFAFGHLTGPCGEYELGLTV